MWLWVETDVNWFLDNRFEDSVALHTQTISHIEKAWSNKKLEQE
jgi:hypothetical protein